MSQTTTKTERAITTTGTAWHRIDVAMQAVTIATHLMQEAGEPDLVDALLRVKHAAQQRRDRA